MSCFLFSFLNFNQENCTNYHWSDLWVPATFATRWKVLDTFLVKVCFHRSVNTQRNASLGLNLSFCLQARRGIPRPCRGLTSAWSTTGPARRPRTASARSRASPWTSTGMRSYSTEEIGRGTEWLLKGERIGKYLCKNIEYIVFTETTLMGWTRTFPYPWTQSSQWTRLGTPSTPGARACSSSPTWSPSTRRTTSGWRMWRCTKCSSLLLTAETTSLWSCSGRSLYPGQMTLITVNPHLWPWAKTQRASSWATATATAVWSSTGSLSTPGGRTSSRRSRSGARGPGPSLSTRAPTASTSPTASLWPRTRTRFVLRTGRMAASNASTWMETSPGPFSLKSLAPEYLVWPTQKPKVNSLAKCFKLLQQTLDNLELEKIWIVVQFGKVQKHQHSKISLILLADLAFELLFDEQKFKTLKRYLAAGIVHLKSWVSCFRRPPARSFWPRVQPESLCQEAHWLHYRHGLGQPLGDLERPRRPPEPPRHRSERGRQHRVRGGAQPL